MNDQLSGRQILAKIIREHYDLGVVQMPQVLADAHQHRHRKLVMTTDVGRFLVKTYKREPEVLDALRFQHRLSDHLKSNGLPVANIQPARSGKRIVEADDWALELQEFVEGDPLTRITPIPLSLASEALGRFHKVCRDFPRPERDARMWRFSEVPRKTFLQLYDRAIEAGDPATVKRQCDDIALFLRDATKRLNWDARNQFETGLIHGDWHGGNLIFQGDRLAAIVDLEFAGDGCYLEDLSYALSNLCVRTTMDRERLNKRSDVLLTYYQDSRTLSFAEHRALYYAVGVKHVATISYQIQRMHGVLAGHDAASWMERLAYQLGWLAERAQNL